jgi:hypothetical protein
MRPVTKVRSDHRASSGARRFLIAAALGILVPLALWYIPTSARHPWDFETYWYAATAWMQGLNPYDTEVLARLALRPVGMPFLYPPITLPLLLPLTFLSFARAAQIWLLLKIVLLVPLILLWRKYFVPGVSLLLLAVVAVLGFNAACVWDLRTGNVAIVEEFLLWSGFAAYAMDRRRLFAVCVVAASLFKLFPILFLGLLLVPSRKSKPGWGLAAGSFAVFAALALLPTWLGPGWAQDFWRRMPAERPWGVVNPSALGLIDTLLGDHAAPLTAPPYRALGLWIAYEALLAGTSVPALRRLWRRRDPREWVPAAAILYALFVPRMMVYSYMLVIVPALALMAPLASRIGGMGSVAGLLVAQALLWPALGWPPGNPWSANFAFLTLLACWLVYLWGPRRDSLAPTIEPRALTPEHVGNDHAR